MPDDSQNVELLQERINQLKNIINVQSWAINGLKSLICRSNHKWTENEADKIIKKVREANDQNRSNVRR